MAERTNSKYAWLKEKKAEWISKGHICISKDYAWLFPSKHMYFICLQQVILAYYPK